ncbi:hypothetical protein ACOMHN_005979 [Nucella lapillus]
MAANGGMGEPIIQTKKDEGGGGGGEGGRGYKEGHQYCSKIRVNDLNQHLMCVLCGGYFIDATTIIECLHSFCRTCILQYLESSKYCPICDVQVHKTRPLLNIRSDKTLQDMVYKLVPGLFDEEMRRRREFLKSHPEVPTSRMDLEQRGQAQLVPVHSLPSQQISLVLHMASPLLQLAGDRRYLLCPSDVTMGILKKFIRCKFNVSDKFQIDLFYTQREEAINDDFTLLDVTFIYSWTREKPLRLFYMVYEQPRRKRRQPTDRLLKLQPSPAKRARLEPAGRCNGLVTNGGRLHQPSKRPSSEAKLSALKKPGVGRPPSKAAKVGSSRPFHKQRVKMRKKDMWKLHAREKLKRTSLDTAKQAGRGRKPKVGVMPPSSEKAGGRKGVGRPPGHAKAQTGVKSERSLNGKATSSILPSSADGVQNGGRGSARDASSGACSAGKESGAAVNGVHKPALRTSLDSRSASPRLSTPGSSRSSSPRLPSRGTRAGSPRARPTSSLGRACAGKDFLSLPSHEDDVKASGRGREGSRPSSRGSSRADSPRLHDLHNAMIAEHLPSLLPLDRKISVDVTMATSASETSSDVTSPGAEDRANSTGLEEAGGDFHHGSAGLMCNVASLAARPFHSLAPADRTTGNNNNGVNADTGFNKQHVHKGSESRLLSKDKINTHNNLPSKGNGVKQNGNKNAGCTTDTHKLNGHRKNTAIAQSERKNNGCTKQAFHSKEAKRATSKKGTPKLHNGTRK